MKKYLLAIGGVITTISPIVISISCGSNSSTRTYTPTRAYAAKDSVFDLSKSTGALKDVRIVSWIDGDTPIVDILDSNGNVDVANKHIRITGIDTPELHARTNGNYAATSGKEYQWALKGQAFGEEVMPKGARVKLFTDGSTSYDRLVGSLFYGGDSSTLKGYKNYSVEILKKGLAMPFLSSASLVLVPSSVFYLTGLALADAYNWAKESHIGIFSESSLDFLRIHGTTDDSAVLWRDGPRTEWDEKNVYDRWKERE